MNALRDMIALFIQKQVDQKKKVDYVPGASNEVQEYISYESFLQMADAIIPMVKREINNKKKKTSI